MTDKEKELQAEAIGYYRKRIAELEMTVGTLRNFSNEQATCIERLEKENAELKKWQKDTIKARGNDYMDWSKMYDQFTNAKELLAKWVKLCKPKLEGYPIPPIQEQTEQFLNSEVEK